MARRETVEGQLSSKTIQSPAPPSCSWSLLCSAVLAVLVSVLFTTLQQINPSSYERPAPPPCSWSLLSCASFSAVLKLCSKTIIQLWEPSSTFLILISPGHWANIVKLWAEMVAPPSKQCCDVQTWNLQLNYQSHNSAWFSHSLSYYHLTHPDTCK